MPIRLYNTLARCKQEFVPLNADRVTMYVCGPTVYSHPHIGNARPAVVFDVLFRLLSALYPKVIYARNITDIDDKINAAARAKQVPIAQITEKYTAIYHQDMQALGVCAPTIEPRATAHIPQMISMITNLIEGGYAYEAQGHVLFNVPAYKAYGSLSRRNREDMIAGARVEVAPYKNDPADFVLWKPSTHAQPGWESPWGRGRPGWHLECSVMSAEHLGETIDIHAGGHDLIFPHHENEIAQSTCAHGGRLFARYWLHNGFINVETEKMSKSIGNILRVDDLLKAHHGEAIRLVLLSTHYRKPLEWNDEVVHLATRNLDRLYGALRDHHEVPPMADADYPNTFMAALQDDLNTPLAISELHAIARELNAVDALEQKSKLKAQLINSAQLLGLLGNDPAQWFAREKDLNTELIDALIASRMEARKARDFTTADKIRDQLSEMDIEIEDLADTTRWKVKS